MCWSAAILCEKAPTAGHEGMPTFYRISSFLVKGMYIHLFGMDIHQYIHLDIHLWTQRSLQTQRTYGPLLHMPTPSTHCWLVVAVVQEFYEGGIQAGNEHTFRGMR